MSTITKEFTKEQLIERTKYGIERYAKAVAGFPRHMDVAMDLELARIALASLEAKPVAAAYVINGVIEADDFASYCGHPKFQDGPIELYANPPAPVSVPDAIEPTVEAIKRILPTSNPDDYAACIGADMWNACRAAMLQGADGNSPVIPDWQTQAEKMAELYGSSFVLFRNGESPQCADPTNVIISFTDEGLWHGAEAHFREIVNSSTNNCRENTETSTKCWCRTCRPVTVTDSRFVLCPECGNKRCPHANDHRNACTGSNEPGQEGSAYPAAPQQEVKS